MRRLLVVALLALTLVASTAAPASAWDETRDWACRHSSHYYRGSPYLWSYYAHGHNVWIGGGHYHYHHREHYSYYNGSWYYTDEHHVWCGGAH